MATKRFAPLDDPPSASSDDDETEDEQEIITQKAIHESSSSSEEEEEEEEDESEEETTVPKETLHEKPKIENPNSKPSEMPCEDESESDSEGELPDPSKNSTGKPKTISLNSPSMFETASEFVVKPAKKINTFESTEKTPTSKRPSSGSDIKNKKKIKVSNGDVDEEKKSVIKRVWSVDDELRLLQGFIDYQLKKGCSPLTDMDGFYQFTMKLIPGYASKSQLYEKVRRLKKKFRVTSEKINANGEDSVFTKPYEQKLFELSSKIWGIDGCETVNAGGGSTAKAKVRIPKVKLKFEVQEKDEEEEKVVKMEDFETLYPYWNAGLASEVSSALKFPAGVVKLVKENLNLIGEAKAKEMNEKWEALFEFESMLRKRRIALLSNVGDAETA